jgi:hypothetical protein
MGLATWTRSLAMTVRRNAAEARVSADYSENCPKGTSFQPMIPLWSLRCGLGDCSRWRISMPLDQN